MRAERGFRASISASPRFAPAWGNIGAVLIELHRFDEGFAALERAAKLNPDHAGIQVNLGNALLQSGRTERAMEAFQHALMVDPDSLDAMTNMLRPTMEACHWSELDRLVMRMKAVAAESLGDGRYGFPPFCTLFLPFDRHDQLLVARREAGEWSMASSAGAKRAPSRSGRIRIAYLSNDFHDHATAHLTLGIYRRHDRDRFEVFAYSMGAPDASDYRRRIAGDCDHFVDVRDWSDAQIAEAIAAAGIDILIDLKGYTGGCRPGVLARRPALVQVNYLGYPGTMGAPFMNYLIADSILIPPHHSDGYSETIIRLPDSYQATDDEQPIDETPMERSAHGLPPEAFVYCSFGTSAKIDRRTFSAWMAILARTPLSVLWLLQPSAAAQISLRDAARKSGIDPARIVFGQPAPKRGHLGRLRLADLSLDTFTCNAHTTATDALWAGVPLLTLTGETFASRVATSLISAVGLPELAVRSEDEYIELAVRLSVEHQRLRAIRQRLVAREATPLFRTSTYVRNLESSFESMLDRQRSDRQ